MRFEWVPCFTQWASQLRQTVLHPYRSSGPIRNNGPRIEQFHQPSFVKWRFRRKHCSHLTITVSPASADSLCPVSVFDGMRPVANAREVCVECWIMTGWGFSGVFLTASIAHSAGTGEKRSALGGVEHYKLSVTGLWGRTREGVSASRVKHDRWMNYCHYI